MLRLFAPLPKRCAVSSWGINKTAPIFTAMQSWPKISLVTTNFNLAPYLEQTLVSVLSQGYPNLEYWVIDGGSTDGSVDIIRKYEGALAGWLSEPDGGMYAGIQKGLSRCTGDIMGYLNSDDLLHPKALFTLAEIFSTLPQIEWLTGTPCFADEAGRLVKINAVERWSRLRLISGDYRWIQQESTFWTRALWHKSGASLDTSLKLAGDFELWLRFSRSAQLYSTTAGLGIFRNRREQKSTLVQAYEAEVQACLQKEPLSPADQQGIAALASLQRKAKLFPFLASRWEAQRNALLALPPKVFFDAGRPGFKLGSR